MDFTGNADPSVVLRQVLCSIERPIIKVQSLFCPKMLETRRLQRGGSGSRVTLDEVSFTNDRLPALTGIVHYYQMATKEVPILGLWERSLSQDLLWMRVTKLDEGVGTTPYQAFNFPSWTWLSCPYTISYDFWKHSSLEDDFSQDIHDHVKLVAWDVVWTSQPLLSVVKSSQLVVEGPSQEHVLSVAPKGKVRNPTYLDVDDEKPDFGCRPFPWRCSGQFDNGPRMYPTRYLCLLLRSRKYKSGGKTFTSETFLILESCSSIDAYQRVGIGNFFSRQ